jgi:tetratricopeptide (TPR) repeat protein
MIVTWKPSGGKSGKVSEELLDENIEVTFKEALELFGKAKQTQDSRFYQSAYGNLKDLIENDRLLTLSTDRHKHVLFETYYHLAEILNFRGEDVKAMRFYLKAIQINDTFRD